MTTFFVFFFLVDEGRDCRTNDGPTFNAGLVTLRFFQEIRTSIARKPYSFVIFQGGGGSRPHVPPLNPPMRIRTVWVQTQCPPSESAHAHTHSLARAFSQFTVKTQTSLHICAVSLETLQYIVCIQYNMVSITSQDMKGT